jgi:glyoxylase-like metal-dependent hydrolase (beta-lactamase superfamily II)
MQIITDGIAILELPVKILGNRDSVFHPILLWDDRDVILVDTGYPGLLPIIQREMGLAGVAFERLTKVILTHQHYDHLGGLPEILSASEHHIEVLAHAQDKPYIEGDKPLLKYDPSNGLPPKAIVDTVIQDNEVLPFLGGLSVIHTPGHTPGHISLYHENSKTLITGDATIADGGKLLGPVEMFTSDMDLAWKSLAKFIKYDVKTALCFHGGICNNFNQQIRSLLTDKDKSN